MPVRTRPLRMPGALLRQAGFSLVEVLISVLILAIGLVGFSALQVRAVKATQSSLQRTEAIMMANFIMESMRVNKAAAVASGLPYNLSGKVCTTPAASTSLASSDLNLWFAAMKLRLGDASSTCAQLACTTAGVCTVDIFWDESRALNGSAAQSVQLVSKL